LPLKRQRLLAKYPREKQRSADAKSDEVYPAAAGLVKRLLAPQDNFSARGRGKALPGGVRGELPRTRVTLAGSLPLLFFGAMWSAMERWGYQSSRRGGGDPVFSGADALRVGRTRTYRLHKIFTIF
jgi:hypothetical protein